MKNKFIGIIVFALIFFLFGVTADAENSADSLIQSSGASELFDSLDDETKSFFEEVGVDGVSFDRLFSVTGRDVLNSFKKMLTGGMESPLNAVIRLTAIMILLSVFECFMHDDSSIKSVAEIASTLFCVVSVISPLTQAISSAVSAVTVSSSFMLALIPVLGAVIAAAGNPTLAVSFQSFSFVAAQIISAISKNIVMPVVGAVLALDITGSIMPSFKLSSLTEFIKKTLTSVITFSATLFVAFLSIKDALANAADTVASRGIKLAISSAVPVVGCALSEAYSGVIGSLVLARSTIGIFGISAIALINLPSCVLLAFWIFALKFGAAVGELFGQQATSNLLRSIASAITLLNVVLIFNAVLFIISTALIITIKAV